MFSAASPWATRRVNTESIDESTRRFLLTLWNTYSFFVTYARLDGWEPAAGRPARAPGTGARARPVDHVAPRSDGRRGHRRARPTSTRWAARRRSNAFVGDLSNWYVRRSRPRFWKSADPAAHATLHECLVTVTLLLAPYCPFITDELYANLTGSADSVHLADWPTSDPSRRDPALDAEMELARAGHVARPFGPHRREDTGAPAAAPRVRPAATGRERCATKWSPRSRPSST